MTMLLHMLHCLICGELSAGLGQVPSTNPILFLADKDTMTLIFHLPKLVPENGVWTKEIPGIS